MKIFLTIELDINNNENIIESLNNWIILEFMDNDNKLFYNICKNYFFYKNVSIEKLPHILIFVLKRFKFIIKNLQIEKLNLVIEKY